MTAIDDLREEGLKVGLIRLRLWRPFPFEELRAAVKGAETLIVLDRALSTGGPGGPVCSGNTLRLIRREPQTENSQFRGRPGRARHYRRRL